MQSWCSGRPSTETLQKCNHVASIRLLMELYVKHALTSTPMIFMLLLEKLIGTVSFPPLARSMRRWGCIYKACGAYPYYLVAFVAKFFERPCGFVDILLWDCISFACHELVYGLLDTRPCVSVRSFTYFMMRCILLAVYETLVQS